MCTIMITDLFDDFSRNIMSIYVTSGWQLTLLFFYMHQCQSGADPGGGQGGHAPPPPQAEIWGNKLAPPPWAPQQTCKKKIYICCMLWFMFISTSVNLMVILYVRKIEIKIRSFCHVHLRHPWCLFCPINVSYYHLKPCQNEMEMKVIWTKIFIKNGEIHC